MTDWQTTAEPPSANAMSDLLHGIGRLNALARQVRAEGYHVEFHSKTGEIVYVNVWNLPEPPK